MDPVAVVIIVAAVGGFAALVGLIIRRNRELSRARERRALERGWSYTAGGGRGRQYTVQGSDGGATWTLAVFPGGKNKQARAAWSIPDPPLSGGAVLVGSKALAALLNNPIGHRLAQWGLQLAAGDEDVSGAWSKLMEGYQVVETGDPTFDGKYAVLATDPSQARKLLIGESCRAILEWDERHKLGPFSRGTLSLTWWDGGLRVAWEGTGLDDPDEMARLVDLALGLRGPCRKEW